MQRIPWQIRLRLRALTVVRIIITTAAITHSTAIVTWLRILLDIIRWYLYTRKRNRRILYKYFWRIIQVIIMQAIRVCFAVIQVLRSRIIVLWIQLRIILMVKLELILSCDCAAITIVIVAIRLWLLLLCEVRSCREERMMVVLRIAWGVQLRCV